MPASERIVLTITPPLRMHVQRGTVQLTIGTDDFRKILLLNPLYWPSHTAGEGLFRKKHLREQEEFHEEHQGPLKLDLDRVLLYPEGNPFDEELQRVQSLRRLWRVLPDLPSSRDFKAALAPRESTSLSPTLNPPWDEIFNTMLEQAVAARRGRGLYRILPAFIRRARARSKLAAKWPVYKESREKEFAEIQKALQELSAAAGSWADREQQRIRSLEKLLQGDLDETTDALKGVLEGVLFPFETTVQARVDSPSLARISFSAPPLDRIVQPSTRDLLSSGEVRKVKRDREEIHRDFSELTAGQALHLAAHLFARIPKMDTVCVACSTRAPASPAKRGRARVSAESSEPFHIFEVEFRRSDFEDELLLPFEPLAMLSEHNARIRPVSSVALGRIEPPQWAAPL